MQRLPAVGLGAVLAAALAGCPSDEEVVELVDIVVTPASLEVAAGDSIQLLADGVWSDATTTDMTTAVDWITADPEEATVDRGGRVQTLVEGQATITATFELFAASALLAIGPPALHELIPTPLALDVAAGEATQVTLVGRFGDGSLIDVTGDATWSSSDAGVAVVDEDGVVTATDAGEAEITASYDDVDVTIPIVAGEVALVAIEVTPAEPAIPLGGELQFVATGVLSDGSTSDVTADAEWTSSDPSHVAIDAETGLATATGTGGAIVGASRSGVSGETVATVVDAEITAVAVEPAEAEMPLGGSFALTATATLSDGETTDLTTSVTWSSDEPLIATASNDAGVAGLVTSVSVGATTVRARYGELEGAAEVTIDPAELVELAIEPSVAETPLGVDQPFTLTGTWTDGAEIDHTADATWATDDPAVAGFGAPGTATPEAEGTCVVTADFGELQAAAALTVAPPALESIAVTPPNVTLAVGELLTFEATGTFSDGSITDLSESVFWASSAPGFLVVTNLLGEEGEATALAEGIATVLASQDAVSGAATVAIGPPAIVSVGIVPLAPSVGVGGTEQLAAGALLTDGDVVDVTADVTWSSADPSIATMSNDVGSEGVLTGVAEGTVDVTATLYDVAAWTVSVEVAAP